MAFYLVKTASKLYLVDTTGAATDLAMPEGINIIAGQRMRGAVLNRHVLAVNGVSRPIWVDPNAATAVPRAMQIPVPPHPPLLAAGAAGGLTGAFNAKVAFLVKDAHGDVLAHGPYSVISNDVTLAAQMASVTNIPVSAHPAVNARRLSRSTVGPGDTQFEWLDIDDNTTLAIADDVADEALSLLPVSDELGQPPADLELIVEWKRRLWGKAKNHPDAVFFSGDGEFYAWAAENEIPIPPLGNDLTGVNGFLARRDELGIGRLDRWWKIIGDDPDNFAKVILVEGTGIRASDSTVVAKDIGYWLADDGVYRWGPEGVKSVSKDKAHSWFTTDDYFNRAEFSRAVGWYDPRFDSYNLLLCAAGTTTLNRWVEYQIGNNRWFGPHLTSAFTPTFAALLADADARALPVLCGSDGFIRKLNQVTPSDDGTAIALDIRLRHNCKTPDIEKVFKHLSILTRAEAGGTLTITPALGGLAASDQAGISHNLTLGRQLLRRLSTIAQPTGRILTLKFTNAENNRAVHIYGYEIPFHETARR